MTTETGTGKTVERLPKVAEESRPENCTVEKRKLFFTMVLHPATGWTRVGNAYGSRKIAHSWLPFVRGAWRGLRAKVSQFTVILENGRPCEKSRRVLDTKYNLDS